MQVHWKETGEMNLLVGAKAQLVWLLSISYGTKGGTEEDHDRKLKWNGPI